MIAGLSLSGCKKDDGSDEPVGDANIIMTVAATANSVRISLAGSETAVVNWRDGNKQTITLTGSRQEIEHSYSSSPNSRTITITGTNITELDCNENQLTALDVSKNTALTTLWCGNNQLTVLDVSQKH